MDVGDQWHRCSWMGFFMQMGANGDGDPRSVGAQQGWVVMGKGTGEDGCPWAW